MVNKYENKKIVLLCIFNLVLVVFMYGRAFFGVGLQDEASYISQALGQMQGNYPFAYDNYIWQTGSAFLSIPLIALYKLVVPSMAGLVLYLRLCFVTFKNICIFIIYRIIRKEMDVYRSLLVVSVLIPNGMRQCMQMFSYNTVYFWLSILTAAIIYDVFENGTVKKGFKLGIAGFLSGIFVFAHQVGAVVVIFFCCIVLLKSDKDHRWKNIFSYCVGGIVEILIVCVPVALKTSWKVLINGFKELIFFEENFGVSENVISTKERFVEVFNGFSDFVFLFFIVTVGVAWFAKNYIVVDGNRLKRDELRVFSAGIGLFVSIIYFIRKLDRNDFYEYLGCVCVLFVILMLLGGGLKKDKVVIFALYPLLFAFFSIVLTNTGSGGFVRMSFCSCIAMIVIWIIVEKDNALLVKLAACIVLATVIGECYHNVKIIHTDEFITKLSTQVKSGVFKGIFTTRERAEIIPEIEEYINSYLDEGDSYSFKDQVPFGPLLVRKGHSLDSKPWDYVEYFYGFNNPNILYHYYQMRGEFPTKIIYVDWNVWHQTTLSIEESQYLFNEWVNAYYDLIDENSFGPVNDKYGEMVDFRVKIYGYSGGFNGDYQKWIDDTSLKINIEE